MKLIIDIVRRWEDSQPIGYDKMYPNLTKWLEHLRPQKHWEPTEEQIKALKWVLQNIPYNTHKQNVSDLLEQLKAL